MITAPYVRGAYAAGKLSIGFWDHWVPGANKASTDVVNEWAEKEKVEVSIDYITSNGSKDEITIAAEAQAKSGHDILRDADLVATCPDRTARADERRDEAAHRAERRRQRHRGVSRPELNDQWHAVPFCVGSQIKGPCSRIDLMKKHAGIDVQEMYPAGARPRPTTGPWIRS